METPPEKPSIFHHGWQAPPLVRDIVMDTARQAYAIARSPADVINQVRQGARVLAKVGSGFGRAPSADFQERALAAIGRLTGAALALAAAPADTLPATRTEKWHSMEIPDQLRRVEAKVDARHAAGVEESPSIRHSAVSMLKLAGRIEGDSNTVVTSRLAGEIVALGVEVLAKRTAQLPAITTQHSPKIPSGKYLAIWAVHEDSFFGPHPSRHSPPARELLEL